MKPASNSDIWINIQRYLNKHHFIFVFAFFLFIITCILIYLFLQQKQVHVQDLTITTDQTRSYLTTTLTQHKNETKFPYRYLVDEKGQIIPVVLVSAFFRDDAARDTYFEYINNGIKVVGITAYKSFPKKITDSGEDKYHLTDTFDYNQIHNWICCFKNPEEFGLSHQNHRLIDISESDFYDLDTSEENIEKKYDVIYICLKDHTSTDNTCPMDGWNAINRNYKLALACLPIMIKEYGLKVLVVGRTGCGLEDLYGDRIETTDFLPYNEFQDKIRQSRILFVPNIYDASPRVVSESIIKGLAVLMNLNILCGSKYITDETGEFFTDDNDIRYALDRLLSKIDKISPKKWWREHYGRQNSGKKMRDFLNECYPKLLEDVKEVYF